jgi:hypothetical protein
MDDSYGDLAFDYEWLFPDETVGRQGRLGATSPGSQAVRRGKRAECRKSLKAGVIRLAGLAGPDLDGS